MDSFHFCFREQILPHLFFLVLHLSGDVAKTEESHSHVIDFFVGGLQALFPIDLAQMLEHAG